MALTERMESLQSKHRHLEDQLHSEALRPAPDDRVIARLKREKLALKDEIERLAHT